MDRLRLERLLDRYVDEALTGEQRVELEQALLASSQARALFWERLRFHAALREVAERSLGAQLVALPAARARSIFRRTLAQGLALAAALAVLAAMGVFWLRHPRTLREPTTSAVAVLTQAAGAQWADGETPRAIGSSLGPGRLRLASGLVQIEFISGARVILEGPADFQLVSPMESFCTAGKCTVEVPPQAQGFTVRAAGLSVVDLGTAFGLEVHPGGASEMQVLRGEVELHSGPQPARTYTEGQGVRLGGDGRVEPLPEPRLDFAGAETLSRRALAGWRERQEAWLAAGARFARDPALAVHYTFEEAAPWSRTLANAAAGAPHSAAGSIVGCRWDEGRWPGKRALHFQGVSDRVRFALPGEFQAVTMAAWVRVDTLDLDLNGLAMADGFDTGKLHWQIVKNGAIRLGVQGANRQNGRNYDSPPVLVDSLARWIFLAVVCDRGAARVTHYLDGRAISSASLADGPPLAIGAAEIGNWNPEGVSKRPIRDLRGAMDEFFIFTRALPASEIQGLYEAGRPQPQG